MRTGPKGATGLSFMILNKNMEGLSTRHMKCTGVHYSGTAFVNIDNVEVSKNNIIGEINEGFKYVMYNFNHERWSLAIQANRMARVAYEEAFKYACKRKTFNK